MFSIAGTNNLGKLNNSLVFLTEDQGHVIPLSFEPLTQFKELKHKVRFNLFSQIR